MSGQRAPTKPGRKSTPSIFPTVTRLNANILFRVMPS